MTNFIEIMGPYDLVAQNGRIAVHHTYNDETTAKEAFRRVIASGSAKEVHLFRFDHGGHDGIQRIAHWKNDREEQLCE